MWKTCVWTIYEKWYYFSGSIVVRFQKWEKISLLLLQYNILISEGLYYRCIS
jgi:hypothetical protein